VSAFRQPILGKSIWQIVNSFVPFVVVCAAMYALVDVSYLATLALGVLAAGFVVRIFILQHDCGHYSFFKSRWANATLGTACSMVTLTPFVHWREQHAQHHRVWNNLDRRDTGLDFYSNCITRAEYDGLSGWEKLKHRFIRNPVFSLLILPPLIFLVLYRLPFDTQKGRWKEHLSVHATNFGVAALVVALGFAFGFGHVAAVQLPIIVMAAIIGVWLFSVQHRFESALWTRQGEWDGVAASLAGSSFLTLPRIFQWLTGNIGYHHIHHLNPLVPNYRLQECHESVPALQQVPTLSFWQALKSSHYILWDEDKAKLVGAGR
jgi:acyl-lipid omega-6 desaturase (Delta-12 desaturase)